MPGNQRQRRQRSHAVIATWLLSAATIAAQNQPTPCFRWSGQITLATAPNNSSMTTLYYHGGQRKLSSSQNSDWWTNALISLDLGQDWQTGRPALSVVQPETEDPASPPAVSLGALWSSADGKTLYQYAGQFQDNPNVPPPAQQVFQYDIDGGRWSVVETTGDQVTRPAEGSTAVVPGQSGGENVGYYFSGHLDSHTVQGWSNQIERVYLDSLVEFDLGTKSMRNITSFSTNATSGPNSVPEIPPVHRADGTFTYVPGLGTDGKGVIVSIGGATTTQYVDNTVLDVFDLGTQGWTKQSTLGDNFGTRVNHCATRATAKINGKLTHQIFIYGGQQLNQSDRDSHVYILNIQNDRWSWVDIGADLPGAPSGRAGHQCALVGNQMVVIGGVIADDILCETPGVFVYNVTSSAWQAEYKAGTTYTTPARIESLLGGVGTGGSTSGSGWALGGDGTQFADTSSSSEDNSDSSSGGANGGSETSDGGKGSSGSSGGPSVGAIAGGVVGALAVLALLALIAIVLMRRRRRERQMAEAAAARDKLGAGPLRSNSGSSDGRWGGTPYEKQPMWGGGDRRFSGSVEHGSVPNFASDDVEEETRGLDFAGSAHLTPKQQLRVMNPE